MYMQNSIGEVFIIISKPGFFNNLVKNNNIHIMLGCFRLLEDIENLLDEYTGC